MSGVSIATHSGIKVYQNGKWLEAKTGLHDYMGFQATKNGFFASGHPEPGANLKNPLGLMKSSDGGNTLEKLAFMENLIFITLLSDIIRKQFIYTMNVQILNCNKVFTSVRTMDKNGKLVN